MQLFPSKSFIRRGIPISDPGRSHVSQVIWNVAVLPQCDERRADPAVLRLVMCNEGAMASFSIHKFISQWAADWPKKHRKRAPFATNCSSAKLQNGAGSWRA
jgi:hypothetical protein